MTDYSDIPVVETARVRLRAPKLGDLPALTAFYQTDRSHLVGGPMDARAVHRAMLSTIGSWALRGYGMWHIADLETDAYLGATGILFAPGWDEPELGWHVIAKAEGRGIAHNAVQAARTYAADRLGLDGVISYIAPDNARSAALARRLGATLEREDMLLDHSVHVYRHPVDITA
ncbi:GNAT family N-acetyltransferase [uncultured Sulfitobacter sp.]|uniref:GNAT family N-acetyltransferase n=1 Tax=uncultured Sulfitobacter sp. TaxID=191468 RepID=UPI0026228835|nr:GNAT family N-acetyltransferase [uncultured Sulfitobacter sp.]